MRQVRLLIIVVGLVAGLGACKSARSPKMEPKADAQSHFNGLDGCFILFDLKKNELVEVFNRQRCRQRQAACSTFKSLWP